ncbi:MAG TPA: N-formylglutamate amidohydrolase [Gammaproteobacteria bacterium]|nr:N-formylglutamate amidohydrolase [Gammaproteobacteria bacterium]
MTAGSRLELVISCEHGGCRVPAEYRALFADAEPVLRSHRGFDAGALALAEALAETFTAPLAYSETTRLLVDLNRSLRHPKLYSEYSRVLGPAERRELLGAHYFPYRERVERLVAEGIARGALVLHVSAHSFTPVLDGQLRSADIGLLYDPSRPAEKALAREWSAALAKSAPEWPVRRNYPYLGAADGLTTQLRKRFGGAEYLGVELEVNQRLAAEPGWPAQARRLAASLEAVLGGGADFAFPDSGRDR